MGVQVSACVWPEVNLKCHLSGAIRLVFLRQDLSLAQSSLIMPYTGWLASLEEPFACFHLPNAGITRAHYHVQMLSHGFWGSNSDPGKRFRHSCLPSPFPH